jgi:hypothetical protein
LPRLASAEIAQREEAALSAAQARVADAQGRLNAASAQVAKLAEEIEATEATLGHVTATSRDGLGCQPAIWYSVPTSGCPSRCRSRACCSRPRWPAGRPGLHRLV